MSLDVHSVNFWFSLSCLCRSWVARCVVFDVAVLLCLSNHSCVDLDPSCASIQIIVVFGAACFVSCDQRCIDSDVSGDHAFSSVDLGCSLYDCRRVDATVLVHEPISFYFRFLSWPSLILHWILNLVKYDGCSMWRPTGRASRTSASS